MIDSSTIMKSRTFLAVLLATMTFALFGVASMAKEPERFTVTVTGHGQDIILIPGLASSGKVWDATVKQLAETHRLHVIQIAGFAGLPPGANGERGEIIRPIVAELSEYAAKLKKPAIAGHSLGGLMALKLAADKPDFVDRVLVVDALPFFPLLFNPAATVESVKLQAAAMREHLLAQTDEVRVTAARESAVRMAKSEANQKAVGEWTASSDPKVVAKAMYEDMTTDLRPVLPKIQAPVTVLYAWDARMGIPAAALDGLYTTAYSGLAGANLRRMEGGFHFIMLDQPGEFAKAVGEFVK
jgi:pimeloyl-ACP methyl ester carboxylesterase